MEFLKVEGMSGRLALRAVLQGEETPLDGSEPCSAFKVFFSSSEAANRAHACLNTLAISPIAPETDLLILKLSESEGKYVSFTIGDGVRHVTMFSRNPTPARVYDALAQFGSVSLISPHQDLGWIVYFESEDEACQAESQMSKIYQLASIKQVIIDPIVYRNFSLDVVTSPSTSTINFFWLRGPAPLTGDIMDWVFQ